MNVTVNDTIIQLHDGAKVIDAVRKYYAIKNQQLPDPMPQVKDGYGNVVGEDGSLSENSVLKVHVDFADAEKKETFCSKLKSIFCRNKNK